MWNCFIASLHQFRNCPVPLVRSSASARRTEARFLGRRWEKRPFAAPACLGGYNLCAADHRRAHAIGCSKLKHTRRRRTDRFCNSDSFVQPHKSTGRPVERGGTRCKSKKKKHKPVSLRIKKFASASRRQPNGRHQRGSKQRGAHRKNLKQILKRENV